MVFLILRHHCPATPHFIMEIPRVYSPTTPAHASRTPTISRSPTQSPPRPLLSGSYVLIQSELAFDSLEDVTPAGPIPRWFPRSHILEVLLSEPRDVLQSERTLLSFVRFAAALYFTAVGMILGFKLQSSEDKTGGSGPQFRSRTYTHVISMILIVLALSTLIVSAVNYFKTVRRYSQRRIHTYGTNNLTLMICVTAVVITLVGINVSLIVEHIVGER